MVFIAFDNSGIKAQSKKEDQGSVLLLSPDDSGGVCDDPSCQMSVSSLHGLYFGVREARTLDLRITQV